jgi:hypothetical protein
MPKGAAHVSPEERLLRWTEPEPNSNCWIWTGAQHGKGYGIVHRENRSKSPHREAYELFVGPIPPGMEIDHRCRVRLCVNPAHLEAVTHQENCARGNLGQAKLRNTTCPRGHAYDAVIMRKGQVVGRACRACWRERRRRYLHAKSLKDRE